VPAAGEVDVVAVRLVVDVFTEVLLVTVLLFEFSVLAQPARLLPSGRLAQAAPCVSSANHVQLVRTVGLDCRRMPLLC